MVPCKHIKNDGWEENIAKQSANAASVVSGELDVKHADDKANRSCWPWHDLENEVISPERKVTYTSNFQKNGGKAKDSMPNFRFLSRKIRCAEKKNQLGDCNPPYDDEGKRK